MSLYPRFPNRYDDNPPEGKESVICASCDAVIHDDDPKVVEVSDTRASGEAEYFCCNDCRSNRIFLATHTNNGKAELKRLVVGLELIADLEIRHRVPTLAYYEADRVQWQEYPIHKHVALEDFQKMARAFLQLFNESGNVCWANDAKDVLK